jgi:(p)ppGpp synthase/HD superfamily hydrolase
MEAEYGIASSWYYDEKGKPSTGSAVPKKLAWINELNKWQKELSDNKKFVEALKIDFFRDRIFVFTPTGEVLDLPDGSTPIDFAYHIHTDIGNHCSMAKINDKAVPLDHKLANGDVIKIVTSQNQEPKRDWLNFVHTTLAKNRIQSWFKKLNRSKNIEYGKDLLDQELSKLKQDPISRVMKNKEKISKVLEKLNYKNFDDLLISVAQGEVKPTQVIKNICSEKEILPPKKKKFMFFEQTDTKTAIIQNEEGLLTNIAKCCNPSLSDKIVAHITRFKGASIHKAKCKELKNIEKGRIVNANWIKNSMPGSLVDVHIKTLDRLGLISDITQLISNLGININNLKAFPRQADDTVHIYLTLEISDIDQLLSVLEKLKKGKGVLEVEKINKKSRWL